MAGHGQFKNIMHRKGAQDKKRANLFNKLAREITVAAKMGMPDAAANPRLRAAIINARAVNMPNDRIDRAIKAGTPGGSDGKNYDEVRYEGFGPGGIALIVDGLTDNRNRTASELRMLFSKQGGNLGESGSVSFMFERVGLIRYALKAGSADKVFEAAVEAGADNAESSDDAHAITTAPDSLGSVRDALEKTLGMAESSALIWKPQVPIMPVDFETAHKLFALMDALDDHDDVQEVSTNAEDIANWPAEWIEKLAA